MKRYWIGPNDQDRYVAFRASFELTHPSEVTIRLFGVSQFIAYMDGEAFAEGPYRFDCNHPEYEELRMTLAAGRHVLAAHVHAEGVVTRIIKAYMPFFSAEILNGEDNVSLCWKALPLTGYSSGIRRINPQLGWVEWCDTQLNPRDFCLPTFDDSDWETPEEVADELGLCKKTALSHLESVPASYQEIGSGKLAETFGYSTDDLSAVFLFRERDGDYPADGVWFRFDLEKVRLFRFSFEVEAPAGTIAEVAYSEYLTGGVVAPFITFSTGTSCNMDHYILQGGRQTFGNLTPRGGRYVELHLIGDANQIRLNTVQFFDRTYFGEPIGAFHCSDPLLERIWMTGVETFRSCAEDGIIDNPTRERGEWTGDVISVGMAISGAAYGDYSLIRQGLRHSAYCASDDGLIAGLCPGGVAYLSTYALQWVSACCEYYKATGDKAFLEEMFPYAQQNVEYFRAHWTPDGVSRDIFWSFVDWGYVTNDGPSDMAVNLHLIASLTSLLRWANILGREEKRAEGFLQQVREVVARYLDKHKGDWACIGLHRAVLAMDCGFFGKEEKSDCLEFIKRHYLRCFPNDRTAPRLGSPYKDNPRLITPYFSHYAFPFLWENGEGDFVLNQYRTCWGWMLEDGRTTWLEVFDPRWSHCHQWSGCPTWQLSRYLLGLRPRYDVAVNTFEIVRQNTSMPSASGTIPVTGGGKISVEWNCEGKSIVYRVTPDCEIKLLVEGALRTVTAGETCTLEV